MSIRAGRMRELVTPEGIGLSLRLGEASERVGAFLIDLSIIGGVLLGLTVGSLAVGVGAGGRAAVIIWLLGFFLLRNFYFALFELRPRAATPGKRAVGIRVASRSGGRLTADAVLARNLSRELEIFLPLSLLSVQGTRADGWLILLGIGWAWIFLFFPLFNRDRLRVGDLLAGTWVVRVPRHTLLADLVQPTMAGREALVFTPAQLAVYGVKELHVLEDVLRSRNSATMEAVSARIAGKIGWVRGAESNSEFLRAFYTALRERLERGLLFGKRQKDKYDRAP